MDFSKLAPLLGRTLVIVAHPDDETITCGGLLQRMRDPCVVFATDGAPEDAYFWSRFGSRERYAAIREQEAQAALADGRLRVSGDVARLAAHATALAGLDDLFATLRGSTTYPAP